MKKVFDPSEVELADLRGDPGRAIEVQEKVKEMLVSNRQRQEGLRQEIFDMGAWAMPGLINSSFIWMNELEKNAPNRNILIDLINDLGHENQAASDLLFRTGILDNPFPVPRRIASSALKKMDWKPDKNNIKRIKAELDTSLKNEDTKKALDLFSILLLSGNKKEMNLALNECKKWTEASYKESGELLSLLVSAYPKHIREILVPVFLSAAEAHEDAHKDKIIHSTIVNSLKPIPGSWLTDGVIIDVSCEVLQDSYIPRHTGIEYLWVDSIKDYRTSNQDSWASNFPEIGDQVYEAGKKMTDQPAASLYRYWFEALEKVGEINYLNEQSYDQDELWGIAAIVELLFAKSRDKKPNPKVVEMLQEIDNNNPTRFYRAKEKYSDTKSGSKTSSELRQRRGPAGLRKTS